MNSDQENQVCHFEERAQIGDSSKQNEDKICTKARFKVEDLEKFS